ncbi:hypothetical protein ADUPG1_012081 [Aduncisulcus paluster]|uniref:non-specific serine/threonine protein kinase n=1 Tax=Aduncisulcus paluster TaxID=2918883 RepID=A0ABQ5JYA3_9EUKA|nr:hypothetical protein ADUPG1_012081 [Aduncisulcus paluster]
MDNTLKLYTTKSPSHQYLYMEHDEEKKEEFSRSSTQSDHDKRYDHDDPGYMTSSTSTHGIQLGRPEKETSMAQDTDKIGVSSVSSVSSTSPSDLASTSYYPFSHHSSHSAILTKDHESDSKSEDVSKSDSITLTSADFITAQCILGHDGFGEVLLVHVDVKGVDFACVLKKITHVGSLDLVRRCRKEFKIQRKLYENCKNRFSHPIFILDLLDKEYRGDFGFIMEYYAGGNVKEFTRSWCILDISSSRSLKKSGIDEKEEDSEVSGSSSDEYSKDSSSDLDSFPHCFDPMTLDPLKVSALCVEIIECLDDVFKANPGFIHRDIKPENFLIKVDRKSSECTAVLSDHGLTQIKRSVTLEYFYSESSSTGVSQKSSKSSTNHVLCDTFGYDSFEALQDMYSQKSDAYSLGITILALFQCRNPFYDMRLLQNASSPTEFVGKLLKLLSEGIGPKLSSSYLFRTLKTIEGGKFKPVYSCLNEIFEGLIKVDIDERMSVHEACERVQSIKPLLPKIGEGWKCPSIDDIVKVQLAKHNGDPGCIVNDYLYEEEEEEENEFENGEKDYSGEESEYERSHSNSSSMPPSWSESTRHEMDESFIVRQSERAIEIEQGSIETEKKKTNRTSRVKEFDGVVYRMRNMNTQKKRGIIDIKQETAKKNEEALKSLILSIKTISTHYGLYSLLEQKFPRFTTIFGKFATSPSAITSNRDLFVLCFECLSLFVKHKVTKEEDGEEDIEVILDESSIKKIIDSFLPQMIKVESVLRMNGEMAKEEEEESGKKEAGVSSITMLLFRILNVSLDKVESIRSRIFPQFYSLLSKILTLGEYKKLENSFIEDILEICRKFSYSHRNSTKDSLLFILLPHILPWMRKYPDKKFFLHWTNILKNITLDEVESVLRMNGEMAKEEEEEESGKKEAGVSSITMLLFRILNVSLDKVESIRSRIFPQFYSLLSKILTLGEYKKLENSFANDILEICRKFSYSHRNFTKDSLLSLLIRHILPWMRKYPDKKFFLLWTNILKNITLDEDNKRPHKVRSSQLWFVFHPVLDVIKDTDFKGVTFDDEAIVRCLLFFAHLSCIPSQAIEIHECIKDDLLDSWFEMVKKNKEEKDDSAGVKCWSKLISILSEIPSIVPQLSPKFDDEMYWCMKNGGRSNYYSRYLGNCFASLKKWKKLIDSIKRCSDSEPPAELYHEHRDEILSVFLEYQSESEIEEHKKEIILCVKCLRWFVCHDNSGSNIFLPNPDLNDLIDTFIDHLSRVEKVLEGDVDEEYCCICMIYTFKVKDKWDSFLPKISPTFQRILERGSEKKLGGNIALHLLITLRNISNSPTFSTRSSILTLIKPYFRYWLRIYNDNKYYGYWMYILSKITLSSDCKTPNKSLCYEAWPLFHPVFDVVKREFVGDKIVKDNHEWVLSFFSNLCCDPIQTLKVFDSVKDLLDKWFKTILRKKHKSGIIFWAGLISMFSAVPSLVPMISPKYDDALKWCKNKNRDCISGYSRKKSVGLRRYQSFDLNSKHVKVCAMAIGSGLFSLIHEGKYKKLNVIVKKLRGKCVHIHESRGELYYQWIIYKEFKHQFCPVPVPYGRYFDEEDDRLCLVMEHCKGGSIWEIFKGENSLYDSPEIGTEDGSMQAVSICSGMICSLGMIIQKMKRFLHLDIKPENFFLRRCGNYGEVVIGDLGCAKVESILSSSPSVIDRKESFDREEYSDSDSSSESCSKNRNYVQGNPHYWPLELLQNLSNPTDLILSRCDAYALGLCIYFVFSGGKLAFPYPHGALNIYNPAKLMCQVDEMIRLRKEELPKLEDTVHYKTLKVSKCEKKREIADIFLEIYNGLTTNDIRKRMQIATYLNEKKKRA